MNRARIRRVEGLADKKSGSVPCPICLIKIGEDVEQGVECFLVDHPEVLGYLKKSGDHLIILHGGGISALRFDKETA